MPWARLDDDFHDNGKILSLSHQAFRLYVCAITYSRRHRTGGFLSRDQVGALCGQQRVNRKAVIELVDKRAWHTAGGLNHGPSGYQIHDFDAYQPREDETAADRMRRYRERHKASPSHGVTTESVTPDDGRVTRNGDAPVPIPSPVPHEASTQSEDLRTKETARAAGPLEVVRAFAVPKPGLAPGSPHLAVQRALATALHCAEPETTSERRKWTSPIAELIRADVTAEEVPALVAAFEEINSVPCTPQGIANQLERLRAPRTPAKQNGHHGKPSPLRQNAAILHTLLHPEEA